MLLSALSGKDYSVMPHYYVPYEQNLPQIKQRAAPEREAPGSVIRTRSHCSRAQSRNCRFRPKSSVRLPVKHKNGFWTVLLDAERRHPVDWLPVDPY